jgi:hypothetical protein
VPPQAHPCASGPTLTPLASLSLLVYAHKQDPSNTYETLNTCSPRRTAKIKFTCGRCDAVSIKPINPHAWASGTVFAKCGKCGITHKLIDNLNLFHELVRGRMCSPRARA